MVSGARMWSIPCVSSRSDCTTRALSPGPISWHTGVPPKSTSCRARVDVTRARLCWEHAQSSIGPQCRNARSKVPLGQSESRESRTRVAALRLNQGGDACDLEAWEQPPRSWEHYPVGRILQGILSLVAAERALAMILEVVGGPFPSPVLVLAAIAGAMAMDTPTSRQLYRFHEPAVAFFDAWLPMFFVPSVAAIALAPALGGGDLLKAAIVLGGTYTFNLWLSAVLCSLVNRFRPGGVSDSDTESDTLTNEAKLRRIRSAAGAWGQAALERGAGWLGEVGAKTNDKEMKKMTPGFLIFTIGLFTAAKKLPPKIRQFLSPTLSSGAVIVLITAIYGSLTLGSWKGGVQLYKSGTGAFLGLLIGPAVASLGFKVHTQRELLHKSIWQLTVVCLLAVPLGLTATAVIGRALGAPAIVTLSLLPATTTLGLAREMGPHLGSNRGLLVAGVTIAGTAGISTARQLMEKWKVVGPTSRGLSVGNSSHTLGASAFPAHVAKRRSY